jgi:hypothetical protein
MTQASSSTRLSRQVDPAVDHIVGAPEAGITMLEYGSYACPYCRAANDRIAEIRTRLGDRLRYAFRHRPIPGNELARRAAELAEMATAKGRFWEAFARWAPSSGLLLLLASIIAVILTNSALATGFLSFWEIPFGFSFGGAEFRLSLLHWINDGLLTIFFLVVGLEIKREFTVGHLATHRSAATPLVAAIGGLVFPVLAYRLISPSRAVGAWLGCADVDGYGFRRRADRDDGSAGAGRAADFPDGGGDR